MKDRIKQLASLGAVVPYCAGATVVQAVKFAVYKAKELPDWFEDTVCDNIDDLVDDFPVVDVFFSNAMSPHDWLEEQQKERY